jgi:VIT1/CCC1 family predicted Fe2+/Mn2+ transporter
MIKEIPRRTDFIHHQMPGILNGIREVVFGAEDGMVSTLGALTGIAVGTSHHLTVVLAGFVIVLVESISMAIGSYLSAKSVKEVEERKMNEEQVELHEHPEAEKRELAGMFVRDGWPEDLATTMAETATTRNGLFLKEMAYRELGIAPDGEENPARNALFMFGSYIIGGAIPVIPYLFLPIKSGLVVSVVATLLGLFALGAATTKFTRRVWWKAGLEILLLASIAAAVGFGIGTLGNRALGL